MTRGKKLAREIFQQTLAAIDIPGVMQRKLEFDGEHHLILPDVRMDLSTVSRVFLVAIGKAAHAMVAGFLLVFPNRLPLSGIVAAPTKPASAAPGLRYFVSGHPIPNEDSWKSAQAILELLRSADQNTLVVFLLSGGGSALVEFPLLEALSLDDVKSINRSLVTCGAPIAAINTVRKHVSAIKGGRLAEAAGPALKLTLAVTDVPVGKESALASGPTVPDPTTIADVPRILDQFQLGDKLPPALIAWIRAGLMPETPKPGHLAFGNSHFLSLLGMEDLFHAAHHAAEARGFLTCCDNSTDDWPIAAAVDSLLGQLRELQSANPRQPVALIADGELSSPVTGGGMGGRNSAFVLACVEKIAGTRLTVLSAGTDGIDGNSPAAGGVADGDTLSRARARGLDTTQFFVHSDAYSFFYKLDDTIVTGPTNNNLRDLRILLSEPTSHLDS